MYLGEFDVSQMIDFKFSTRTASGPANLTSGAVSVYKANGTTESTSGVTLTAPFDSVVGLNHVRIDLSSDGTFYATANDFQVVITAGTVGGVSVVGEVIGHFSIRNRAGLYPTTAGRTLDVSAGGEAGVDWANVGSPTTTVGLSGTTVKTATDVETDTADIQSRLPAALTGAGNIKADMLAISDDATAADNLETMLDGTGGQVLSLKQINIVNSTGSAIVATSSGSNGYGILATGNGSGAGIGADGGATGHGMELVAGATGGDGLRCMSQEPEGNGIAAFGGSGTGAGAGMYLSGKASSGDGLYIDATTGHAINLVPAGTNKHGILATGGNSGVCDGAKFVAGTGGVPIRGDITGNITGNVSGSVGSVSGAVGSVTGNVGGNVTGSIGSLATQAKADVNAEVVDTLATDTYAEPSGAPAATATLAAKINRIYQVLRNKLTVSATAKTFYDDSASSLWSKSLSDDGTTYTENEGS